MTDNTSKAGAPEMDQKYKMTISRLTVDKLGVKLYDRVSAVIAEIVANSYDADAEEVVIRAPMDQLLATKSKGKINDAGYSIEVSDNGCGMTASEVNAFYLKVGAERRADPRRGDVSKKLGRKVMGRKGVGKLAPFGVCQRIEVISRGGEIVSGQGEDGKPTTGHVTAHLILERDKILSDVDTPYYPLPGPLDGKIDARPGTTIRMTLFDHRRVPAIEDFERQMAQRFGMATGNWRVVLEDSRKKKGEPNFERVVGSFELQVKAETKIIFKPRATGAPGSKNEADYVATGPLGVSLHGFKPGFEYEGVFYPITGWVGYAEKPYRDQLMAGVRIYCRGKIAGQTAIFNRGAGFTGEFDVRSYFVGELHADWLDEAEDLIRTDRQDILWSHDLGVAFQAWGQALVELIGRLTREPMRKSAWDRFKAVSKIEKRVADNFPGKQQSAIRDQTIEMAQMIAKTARGDELEDTEIVESLVQLSLLLGPHITLDRKLREAAASKDCPMAVVSEVLKTARVAELASFGRIADERVRVIETLELLKDTAGTREGEFQKLLTEAPWLINPTWSPIVANQSFETLREEFVKFYERRTGEKLTLDDFSDPDKRCDFVLSSQDDAIQIIEIKRPRHALTNEEMVRITNYHDLMISFLNEAGNEAFKTKFPRFHITVVCDFLSLSNVSKAAFDGFKESGVLTHINWTTFLLRTREMHQGFLNEAKRQRELATCQT
jgi:Histidine kinase-, DNA gyrase B-, and HSP90-like ATPase